MKPKDYDLEKPTIICKTYSRKQYAKYWPVHETLWFEQTYELTQVIGLLLALPWLVVKKLFTGDTGSRKTEITRQDDDDRYLDISKFL